MADGETSSRKRVLLVLFIVCLDAFKSRPDIILDHFVGHVAESDVSFTVTSRKDVFN